MPKLNKNQHSEIYNYIRNKVETEWPDWKKFIYNNSIAISAHAEKIKYSGDDK